MDAITKIFSQPSLPPQLFEALRRYFATAAVYTHARREVVRLQEEGDADPVREAYVKLADDAAGMAYKMAESALIDLAERLPEAEEPNADASKAEPWGLEAGRRRGAPR